MIKNLLLRYKKGKRSIYLSLKIMENEKNKFNRKNCLKKYKFKLNKNKKLKT